MSFAGPFTVRAGIKLARSRYPESLVFLEHHFGTKLAAQNQSLFEEISKLAQEKGIAIDFLTRLAEKASRRDR